MREPYTDKVTQDCIASSAPRAFKVEMKAGRPAITFQPCGRTSWNAGDVVHHYCVACDRWFHAKEEEA